MRCERILKSVAITAMLCCCYVLIPIEHLFSLLLAILVHEAGHLAAMYMFGLKPRRIKLELSGFCIDYSGIGTECSDIIVALAGPFLGLVYAFAVKDTLNISAQLSCLYSCVNMIPVKPLDGWRIFDGFFALWLGENRGEALLRQISIGFCCMIFALGLWLAAKGEGSGLLAFSFWLILLQT